MLAVRFPMCFLGKTTKWALQQISAHSFKKSSIDLTFTDISAKLSKSSIIARENPKKYCIHKFRLSRVMLYPFPNKSLHPQKEK